MPSKSSTPMVDESAIRTRAYLMWEADGKPDGRSDHYWSLAYAEAAKPKRAASRAKAAPEKKTAAKKPSSKKAAAKKPAAAKAKKKK